MEVSAQNTGGVDRDSMSNLGHMDSLILELVGDGSPGLHQVKLCVVVVLPRPYVGEVLRLWLH